ncbi:FGFR1 oncogene partner 2 homolog [Scaptodrosophila lebanonensis]|uniref:FGFR1 oncogene partner 2 homolog n=1 Tax=Drosophila lebanonensis TaxID=7225 RepID=A0A6J2SXF6_DROLE|nr:FGFR1 oncogene partner 2 homolog [Scaptodrosophila lebanonensis]
MDSSNNSVMCLIKRAESLSGVFGELLKQTNDLLAESHHVDQVMINCCKFRDDQLLKHLVEHITDQDQLQLLRENAELKSTVDEYQAGIEKIMSKYKEHCNSDVLNETYSLREKYINQLESIVRCQDERIEHMAKVMKMSADLDERESTDIQRTIRQLASENEEMRRKLQISCNGDEDAFKQNAPHRSECSTQMDLMDLSDFSDAASQCSFDSFMTCLSFAGIDTSSSSCSSIVNEIDVNRFIDEALQLGEQGEKVPQPKQT